MFPASYFPPGFWPPNYWPKTGLRRTRGGGFPGDTGRRRLMLQMMDQQSRISTQRRNYRDNFRNIIPDPQNQDQLAAAAAAYTVLLSEL